MTPEEVAAAICYLAGPDAGSTTGADLVVDGGILGTRIPAPPTGGALVKRRGSGVAAVAHLATCRQVVGAPMEGSAMLAAAYEGEGRVAVRDVEQRDPGTGEVQLRVAYVGICGTDLHILDGEMDARVSVPAILGHEMSGTVAAVGPGVTDWAEGDEVVVVPLDWCGTCPACVRGHSHICYRLNFIGIDSPGAMQDALERPTAHARSRPELVSA